MKKKHGAAQQQHCKRVTAWSGTAQHNTARHNAVLCKHSIAFHDAAAHYTAVQQNAMQPMTTQSSTAYICAVQHMVLLATHNVSPIHKQVDVKLSYVSHTFQRAYLRCHGHIWLVQTGVLLLDLAGQEACNKQCALACQTSECM